MALLLLRNKALFRFLKRATGMLRDHNNITAAQQEEGN
jgi:hypothetical protein